MTIESEDIYNNNSYISNNPDLHAEDSEYKFRQFEEMLKYVEIKNNHLKLLDVGGGAGILGKMVLEYYVNKGVNVTMHALDLSAEMLIIQKNNNKNIQKVWNCTLEECPENDYDLVLMIDVIEHIPKKDSAANALNKISRFLIYNIPIQINAFDILRNVLNRFTFYAEQKRILGHVHFFTKASAFRFLWKHHEVIVGSFRPYCFMMKESMYPCYIELRKSKLRMKEVEVSCWISSKLKWASPWIVQGSVFSLVKSPQRDHEIN